MTVLAAALQKSGLHPRDVALKLALSKFYNDGGTYERAVAIVRDAYGMSGEGQSSSAAGQIAVAQTRQQVEDVRGQGSRAEGQSRFAPSSSFNRGGEGQNQDAMSRKLHAQPVREPSASQRAIAGSVAKVVAITVLDSFKVRDGRAIGDVRIGEVDRLRATNAMEAAVFKQIQNYARADHSSKVRDVVPAKELQKMIQRAAETADAQ